MLASKRPASLPSDTSRVKRLRLNDKVATRRKTRFVKKAGHPAGSDSNNSTSEQVLAEEDGHEQSPATDQGRSLGPRNDILSTMTLHLAYPLVASDKKSSCSPAANDPSTSCRETTFRSFG
jgi:hypothetical protein